MYKEQIITNLEYLQNANISEVSAFLDLVMYIRGDFLKMVGAKSFKEWLNQPHES